VKKLLEIFLGVMTALGGFVDIGELVFTAQAGARFRYSLLWPIVIGTIGIIVYSEMSGRIAAVAREPVFAVIKDRLGRRPSLVVWVASTLVNVATCAAEIGGLAIVLRLLTGFAPSWLPVVPAVALIAIVWFLPFKWQERLFGIAGLLMIAFFAAAIAVGPDWQAAGKGLVPNLPHFHTSREPLLYAYFVVGILSSLMMPYEVYFYSSGGIEEDWTPSDVPMNKAISAVGFSLGALVTMAILVLGAEVFAPAGIEPDTLGAAALLVGQPYGRLGVTLALLGMLAAIAGAAVETALAAGYNFAQQFELPWGRSRPARETPAFDAAWIGAFVLAAAIILAGVDPMTIVELSVLLAVVCLPFTYLPILLAARDPALMGAHRNGRVTSALGWAFFVIICIAAITAPVLLVVTGMGSY
jgi:Mn2+/Fe2+ NRAMP family transporter